MTELRAIDVDQWPRREHFAHYRERVQCTFEVTVDLDVTAFVAAVRASDAKTYASQIWAIATVVNRHPEFRMQLRGDGSPAVWDVVHPMVTVFHPETETFSALVLPFDEDFRWFHDAALATMEQYRDDVRMFPQDDRPRNVFDVSTLPRTSFTGFALHVRDGYDHLMPIITLGGYRTVGDRTVVPVAMQVNHAAADGFHASRLLDELEALFAEPTWLR
ncbi:chloramphenicol O-acetyltransferase type A [Curtobacterium sp. UNCCL20]|uniref:CatA-like O-acetyltransferase n=1 Tax=Curtobacterium sp. UNCCL20 TaxID=1502773 RepID=UPI0008832266|nr:CatA-like O-acetyltransferase [Curtobacterium sp. UNCCL20]SDQ61024.1 chloramphenicol O-acetyltransferase type A [Curtobacterium sp. UNCCL20]